MRHALVAAVLLAACSTPEGGDGDSGTADGVASAVIGIEGGALVSRDGRVTLTIPPGAVAEDTTFTIAPAPEARAAARLGPAWTIGPDDLALNALATIEIRYLPEETAGLDETTLLMLVLDETSGTWGLATPSSVDVASRTVSTSRAHFSTLSFTDVARGYAEAGIDSLVPAENVLRVEESGDDATGTGSAGRPLRSLREACARTDDFSAYRVGTTAFAIDYSSVTEIRVGIGDFEIGIGDFASGTATRCQAPVRGDRDATTFLQGSGSLILMRGGSDFTVEGGAGVALIDGPRLERAAITGSTSREALNAGCWEGCVVSDVAIDCAARVGRGVVASYGVELSRISVHGCGTGFHGYPFSRSGSPRQVTLEDSDLTGNDVGVHLAGVASVTSTDVRDNRIGVQATASASLAGGGNVFACNSEVDLEALDGSRVDASGNAWDHVPPAIADGSDPAQNDVRGDVVTTGATLAPDPCLTGTTSGVRVIVQSGDSIDGATDPVVEVDFASVARGPTGAICANVYTADARTHLVCERGGLLFTVLSEGDTIPGSDLTAGAIQRYPGHVVGDDVVAFQAGLIVVMGTGGTGGRSFSAEGGASELHMTADGSLIVWDAPEEVWANRGGATSVRVFGRGMATSDGTDSLNFAVEPAVDEARAIWARGATAGVGSAILVDRGAGPVATALRADAAIGGGLTIREVLSYGVGPLGQVYARVYATTTGGLVQLVRMTPDGTLTVIPATVEGRPITWQERILVARDGSAVVMGALDGTNDALLHVGVDGVVRVLFEAGDPIPGGGTATFANYNFGMYDYLSDGTFMLRARTADDQWHFLRGPVAGPIASVVRSGAPLESGGMSVVEIHARTPTHLGGARAIGPDGQIVFVALLENLADYALVTTVP